MIYCSFLLLTDICNINVSFLIMRSSVQFWIYVLFGSSSCYTSSIKSYVEINFVSILLSVLITPV